MMKGTIGPMLNPGRKMPKYASWMEADEEEDTPFGGTSCIGPMFCPGQSDEEATGNMVIGIKWVS